MYIQHEKEKRLAQGANLYGINIHITDSQKKEITIARVRKIGDRFHYEWMKPDHFEPRLSDDGFSSAFVAKRAMQDALPDAETISANDMKAEIDQRLNAITTLLSNMEIRDQESRFIHDELDIESELEVIKLREYIRYQRRFEYDGDRNFSIDGRTILFADEQHNVFGHHLVVFDNGQGLPGEHVSLPYETDVIVERVASGPNKYGYTTDLDNAQYYTNWRLLLYSGNHIRYQLKYNYMGRPEQMSGVTLEISIYDHHDGTRSVSFSTNQDGSGIQDFMYRLILWEIYKKMFNVASQYTPHYDMFPQTIDTSYVEPTWDDESTLPGQMLQAHKDGTIILVSAYSRVIDIETSEDGEIYVLCSDPDTGEIKRDRHSSARTIEITYPTNR